jgi:hypothetical protein
LGKAGRVRDGGVQVGKPEMRREKREERRGKREEGRQFFIFYLLFSNF